MHLLRFRRGWNRPAPLHPSSAGPPNGTISSVPGGGAGRHGASTQGGHDPVLVDGGL